MRLKFTAAGRAALIDASHTGSNAVRVAEIGVTETAFTPDPEGGDLVLPGERKRLQTFGGKAVADDVIHVTLRDESTDVYALRGIGLYLDDGTLLCVYGQPEIILEKSAQAIVLLSADLMLADIDARQIVFGSTEFLNPPATTEAQGVVELATPQEAIRGLDRSRAITPETMKAALDTRLGEHAPTDLAKTLLAAATEAAMRAVMQLRSAALKDEGEGNGLDADLLDGQDGTYYLAYENLTGRPRSFLLTGQIVVMASPHPPAGLLLCDGAAVSRSDYPDLFAAIGTTYGAGDGATTFNLPRFSSGQTALHSEQPEIVGRNSAGEVISHAHSASAAAVGDHAHFTAIAAAGEHGHGAGCHAAGEHTHATWTDAQGNHAHNGSTAGAGGHSHVFGNMWQRYASGRDLGFHESNGGVAATNEAGHHAHSLSTDWQGHHAHNIGMNGGGHHAHQIDIGAGGHHAHGVDHRGAGNHTHAVSVAAVGGSANFAAGLHMIYCIAY